MAEVLLGVVGGAIGSAIPGVGMMAGFNIGATLGTLLFPPGGPSMDRGRIDEIKIQNASQGSPIPIYYGRNRGAGTIIWATGVKESSSTTTVGGKGGGGGSSVTDYSYSTSLAVYVAEGPISKIRRIWANEKVIYDWRTGGSPTVASYLNADNIRVYDGTQTLADEAIEADKGAGNVPAFMGNAYVVFENLPLAEFGNSVPNFNFEVEPLIADAEEAALDVAARSGLEPGDCDFSAFAGLPTHGLLVGARTEGGRILDVLAMALRADIVESGGKVVGVLRAGTAVATITEDDLGASSEDGGRGAWIETVRAQEVELPRDLIVSYNSEAIDFQVWTQRARRIARYSEEQETVAVPLGMTDEYARFLADSLLMERWAARKTATAYLMPKWLVLDPGDVVAVPTGLGSSRTYRVLSVSFGGPSEVEVNLVEDDPVFYEDPGLPASIPDGGSVGLTDEPGEFLVGDIPAPSDAYADAPNLFFVAGRGAAGWRGGIIQASPKLKKLNEWVTLEDLVSFTSSSTFGRTADSAAGILASVSSPGIVDRVNTVRVEMVSGSLSSCTENEMIQEGRNLAVVGDEIIQFATATAVSAGVYDLSVLLRYRRGTDYLLNEGESHVQGEPFYLLNEKARNFAFDGMVIGDAHNYRLIETGRDYGGGYPSYSGGGTLVGRSRMPYAPCLVTATGSRPGDVVIGWTRRTRKRGELIDGFDAPLDETYSAFDVEIWNSSLSTLLRTQALITANDWTYTAMMQSLDGVSGSPFKVRVYQRAILATGVERGFGSAPLLVP